MYSEERKFTFTKSDASILNVIVRSPDLSSSSHYGQYTWKCAEALSSFVASNSELIAGRRVLELGAGTALCGLVAALCGATWVTCSDNDVALLHDLQENIRLNNLSNVSFCSVDWNHPSASRLSFDVLLAADCLFDKSGLYMVKSSAYSRQYMSHLFVQYRCL
ncbi:unnamed protein product [Calicophoron daubneyi]|uniref:Uncharacterized protein n=1 Tax=Calicophoron daubneyi TaxID=300641 RepID=A0AAV2U1C3_CALDB